MEFWRRQKRILTAFGVFLIFMLLCTIISRSVYASKLPRVTVETPRRMALDHTVEADGIVRQGREYAVTALSGLRVRTVYASIGDRVTPETLLFDLDMEDLKEKIQEKELEIRKLELQIAAMEQNKSLQDQKQQMERDRAQEDYVREEDRVNQALGRAREDLENAEDAYDNHKDHPVQVTSEEERKAQQAAYEAWSEKEAELKAEMEAAQKEYEAAAEKGKALEAAAAGRTGSDEDAGNSAEAENGPEAGGGEDAGNSAEAENGPEAGENGDDGSGAKPEAGADSGDDSGTGSRESEFPELAEAKRLMEEAEEKWKAAKDAYEAHVKAPVPKPDFSAEDAARSAWEEKKDSLEDAVDSAGRAVEDAERSRSDAVLDAGRKLADSQLAADADSSLAVSRLELSVLETELNACRRVQDASGQVYPEAEGIITRIQVSPGERVGDGAALVYADLSSPMQFQVSLTKEQKKYVNQGDMAALKLGSSSAKELEVDYIAENEINPELYDARIFLPDGVGTIGQSGNFQVKAQSETFSCCIPLNAVHEDSSRRNFVYVVSERAGILGTELVAERVYVRILDQNDRYAAIEEGVIDRETGVIVNATEELEDKTVVRYEES